MQILKLSDKNQSAVINQAVEVLKNSGIVIYPTETCYGVAVIASDQTAVDKLLKYKRRPEGKAISVAVSDKTMAKKYVELNSEAEEIYDKFLPGPITVISQVKAPIAKGLAAEDRTLGIRIPDFELVLRLVKKLNKPITATSANSAGKKTPYTIADVFDNLTEKQKSLIDLVIDAGELPHNPPSTVINTTKQDMQILRQGSYHHYQNNKQVLINSSQKMQEQGSNLIKKIEAELMNKAILIMFNADLGAGKTQFTKGIGQALGIKEIISSPTYAILNEYDFRLNSKPGKLIHIDAWRLGSLDELRELGVEKYLTKGNVIVIEWAGAAVRFFNDLISNRPVKAIEIEIIYQSQTQRLLKIYE